MRRNPHTGPRAEIYAHFRRFQSPMFTLCSQVPVALPKAEYFGGMLWAVLHAANQVPELRDRIVVDGQDWIERHEAVDCTCTVATEDGGFVFCPIPWNPRRSDFLAALPSHIKDAQSRGQLIPPGRPRSDMLFLSCVPWIQVNSVQHAMSGDPDDSIPRILWGKIADGQVGVCVTAHHSLVDGRHIAQFFKHLQSALQPQRREST